MDDNKYNQNKIRNFCIIAHIDHGKSTLADRMLEMTGTIEKRKMKEQVLDTMGLERERGITIKMAPVRMIYHPNGMVNSLQLTNDSQVSNVKSQPLLNLKQEFVLNLIDTPGHVDFGYEVSRSLAAVEGAVLLVDATKGVQAQTLYNFEQAQKQGLKIISAVNKIDLPNARPQETKEEMASLVGCDIEDIFEISGKTGEGVDKLLEAICAQLPTPKGNSEKPLRALIFDSKYDSYKGVIAYVRLVDGRVKPGDKIFMMAGKAQTDVLEVGYFKPGFVKSDGLGAGEIGYIATGLKDLSKVRVGDTITNFQFPISNLQTPNIEPLPGYTEPQPVVFASFYPKDADAFESLRDSLSKLKLNDSSLFFEPESSETMGRGFRCGFLGMLHMDIVRERLLREFNTDPLATIPSVVYQIKTVKGYEQLVYRPSQLPDSSQITEIREPFVSVEIIANDNHSGAIMKLLESARGSYKNMEYLSVQKVLITYDVPLSEIIIDFYDKLKSATQGYASLSYKIKGFVVSDLERLDILVAGEKVDALTMIVPREAAHQRGKFIVERLRELIPKQMFMVALQAAIGSKIIARESIAAMKKDVTGHLYGGDRSRKMKLWKKQKEGKERMKKEGRVEIPSDVFLNLFKKE
ncbi:MAG: Elongation factor 4 [Parcubacteria group bacterium GW2011_GWD2_38_12]|nr:MAG: Elongation factor 4 [Parcubacteria group bacterium GW2011_GWC2_36_17]KKQ51742.1 MAG: Elongation factor 4 [Parcubacteria group bacterium GW2011_GWD2_38_12]KKQ58191.1 MAG: Elongation factor 4 [Parcubacteria group bacterium GW2011_GWC1_38_17]